jgi:molybdopterin biosynthesis enzyme
MIVRAAAADALVHVPRGAGELPAGATVSWLRLGERY